jgi:hypothetical protein
MVREIREPSQPNNIFSMLYTIPLEVRRNTNAADGGTGVGGPTNEQIHRATTNTTFGNIISPVNATCPISRDEFYDESEITIIRGCNHIFNRYSLREWFVNHSTCPMCRGDIRQYRPTARAEHLPEHPQPANLSIDSIDPEQMTFSYDVPITYNNDQIYRDIVNTVNGMTNYRRHNDERYDDDDDDMNVD